MTPFEAHAFFAARESDHSVLPTVAEFRGMDCWPARATAHAVLSGMLDDCLTDADLDAAVRHCLATIDILIDSMASDSERIMAEINSGIERETRKVLAELMAWGERVELLAMGGERADLLAMGPQRN